MLTLRDLDFENMDTLGKRMHDEDMLDSLNEIKRTKKTLGAFTVRDMVEAVYGEESANIMLGEGVGDDVTVDELTVTGDIRESIGKDRRDVGGNRLPKRKVNEMSNDDRQSLSTALKKQEEVVRKAAEDSIDNFYNEDAKLFKGQKFENVDNYSEDHDEIVRILNEVRDA